jgi:light-regulated signal transduction histidine kinase (bacteriophytochrome)
MRGTCRDDAAEIVVEDNGIGIDPVHSRNASSECFSGCIVDEKQYAGAGIGLALVPACR